MLKYGLSLIIVLSGINFGLSQTPTQAGSQTPIDAANFQPGSGGLNFSNRMGQVFSPNDLASQLQNLRGVVDQTMPLLSAFNENYSNSATGTRPTVGGTLSGLVTDVLHRNQANNQNQGSSALTATNLLALLHGLVNTNTTGAVGASPNNAEDLKALQASLQTVDSILQRLNVSASVNQRPDTTTGTVPMTNPPLTPTGR